MKAVVPASWGGWLYHNYTSSDGLRDYYQRIEVLSWGEHPVVIALDPAQTPNNALPVDKPSVVRLSALSREPTA